MCVDNQITEAYKWISEILESKEIDFLIIGGTAAYLYGSQREIVDVDIGITSPNLFTIYDSIQKYIVEDFLNGYSDELWQLELLVCRYNIVTIDIFHIDTLKYYNSEIESWDTINYHLFQHVEQEENIYPVIDKDELIRYKKGLGREIDIIDIKSLTV